MTSMPARASRPLPAAVLFDFDGTLADSLPLIAASIIESVRADIPMTSASAAYIESVLYDIESFHRQGPFHISLEY